MRGIPPFVDGTRPFLGLLSTRAQAEVSTFLLANGGETFSLEELKNGTGLSRASVRDAVRALVSWGQTRVANPQAKRKRYTANEDSPISMTLHLLAAAAADAVWPAESEFPRVMADVAEAVGAAVPPIFTGAYVELGSRLTPGKGPTEAAPTIAPFSVIDRQTNEQSGTEA